MSEQAHSEHTHSEQITVVDHPVILDALSQLRATSTPPSLFRQLVRRIALLLAAEATRDLGLTTRRIETPLETIDDAPTLANSPIVVSILRAGNGMVDGVLDLLPEASVGHIGLFRNEQLEAVEYYFKMPPEVAGRDVLVVDPMLATAGTAVAALNKLAGLGQASTKLLTVLSAPEGLRHLHAHHPSIQVFTAAVDHQLDEKGYILPGLGDAGDRIYGTLHDERTP